MSRVTLTFDDHDGQVGMSIDLHEPYNEQSNAHKTANMVLNWLDSVNQVISTGDELEARETQDVEPRLVKTMDEINSIKASTLARIADQRIVLAG